MDWWPLTRDILWFLIALSSLYSILYNNFVQWYEAIILFCLYFINCLALYADKFLRKFIGINNTKNLYFINKIFYIYYLAKATFIGHTVRNSLTYSDARITIDNMGDDDATFEFFLLNVPVKGNAWQYILWALSWPLQVLFFLTIPNIRYPCSRNCEICCIIVCFCWMTGLSYFAVWMTNIMGNYYQK